jgi:phosphate transport system permease protein
MSTFTFTLILLGLAGVGFFLARQRAFAIAGTIPQSLHSRPGYHGWHSALWTFVPAGLLLLAWISLAPGIIGDMAMAQLPPEARPTDPIFAKVMLSEARGIVAGKVTMASTPEAQQLAAVYGGLWSRGSWIVGGLAVALAAVGLLYAMLQVKRDFRARTRVERFVMGLLMFSSIVAILTTFGIVASLIFESLRFFSKVPISEFLFGLHWSPQVAIRADQVGSTGGFGAVPVFWGTFFIGVIIAMFIAVPVGLMCAIYLTQYATARVRKILKPVLEILAGVPTVVYGFFAALTVAPLIRDMGTSIGLEVASQSALAAGLVMGVMIIPFVSSLSDDAITAVPQSMKDGSLAMGATPSETIRKVLVPAALPGIVGGVLLAVSRAIGETMIVVMAAGLEAKLTANPFDTVTTVTVQIVKLLTGDQEADSPKTLAAFALGMVLFVVTLILNIYALRIVKKYREAYD